MLCGGESLPSASLSRSPQALDILVSGSRFLLGVAGAAVGGGGGERTLGSIERELSPSSFLGAEGHWW